MVRIRESTIIDAPVEHVWQLLRDFNAHHRWHPAIVSSHMEDGLPPDCVGGVRNFRLADGGVLREQLIRCSDRDRSLSYCLLEAPVPLIGYVAHMRLRPVTDGARCYLEWFSEFHPPAPDLAAMVTLVRDGVYRAGFAALKDWFAGRSQVVKPTVAPMPVAANPAPKSADVGVFVTAYGGPDVLAVQPISVAPPGIGEVTIAHSHIGVNFIDIHCRTGHFPLVAPPGIPGMEAAGHVAAVGPGVGHLQVGDRVAYACAPPGAYCSARTMAAEKVIRLPDAMTDAMAAGHLLRGITASFLTRSVHVLQPGDWVLVHAAGGGLGQILVQWANRAGAHVIATASDDAKLRRARDHGADVVINYSTTDFAGAVLHETAGRGVDVVYDGVGRATFAGSVRACAVRGHLVSLGEASGPVGDWNIDNLAARSLTLSRPNYGHFTRTRAEVEDHAAAFFGQVLSGRISLAEPQVLPLADAPEAHRRLASRQSDSPIVLRI